MSQAQQLSQPGPLSTNPPQCSRLCEADLGLRHWLQAHEPVAVAFSGGMDSSLLVYLGRVVLGRSRLIATVGVSESLSRRALERCRELAHRYDFPLRELSTSELSDETYAENDGNRCLVCKTSLYVRIQSYLRQEIAGDWVLVDGLHADDTRHAQGGLRAAEQENVRHPFRELGIGKELIRELGEHYQLEAVAFAPDACLASRLSRGTRVSAARLKMIEDGEEFIRKHLGGTIRLRTHETAGKKLLARIEVEATQWSCLADDRLRLAIDSEMRRIGYTYVTFDSMGYVRGGA